MSAHVTCDVPGADHRHSCVMQRRMGLLLTVALASAVGCSTQPTFTPGSGGSDFGSIYDPAGNTYRIFEQEDGSVRVEAQGIDGDMVFTIDEEGRLTNITLEDGSEIDFQHQGNGTAVVTGNGLYGGQPVSFNFVIDVPDPSAKLMNRAQSTGDPFIVCVIIDLVCESLEDLIAELLPPMLDIIIDENLPAIIEETGLGLFLPALGIDPATVRFPTGNADIDDRVRARAMEYVEPHLQQARNFCAHWQLLRLLEISACDG